MGRKQSRLAGFFRMMAKIDPRPFRPSTEKKTEIKPLTEFGRKQAEQSLNATKRAIEYNAKHRDSPPVRRAKIRARLFKEITKKYPGESYKVRRSMAFAKARRYSHGEVEPAVQIRRSA